MLARPTFRSMRLHHLRPDELSGEQRELYDVLTTGSRQQVTRTVPMAVRMMESAIRLRPPSPEATRSA